MKPKPEEVTVYSTEKFDNRENLSILRMALHPMDSAPGVGSYSDRREWDFRVIWRVNCWPDWCWGKSCLGIDRYTTGDLSFDNIQEAFEWLLDGEDK